MDSSQPALELLAHFERPEARPFSPPHVTPTRGILWVVKWSAAFSVLFVTSVTLIQFAYCVAAEQTLSRAARDGVLEATLPRATHQSIADTVERRLTRDSIPTGSLRIAMQQNGVPVGRVYRPAEGDNLSITVSLPADAALPAWLQAINFWRGESQIDARAERQIPGRHLRMTAQN